MWLKVSLHRFFVSFALVGCTILHPSLAIARPSAGRIKIAGSTQPTSTQDGTSLPKNVLPAKRT